MHNPMYDLEHFRVTEHVPAPQPEPASEAPTEPRWELTLFAIGIGFEPWPDHGTFATKQEALEARIKILANRPSLHATWVNVAEVELEAPLMLDEDEDEEQDADYNCDNEFGLRCPDCNNSDCLDVAAFVWVRLTNHGSDPNESYNADQEWGDQSPCHCDHCGWHGTAKDAGY